MFSSELDSDRELMKGEGDGGESVGTSKRAGKTEKLESTFKTTVLGTYIVWKINVAALDFC